jgi:hypothetical protein
MTRTEYSFRKNADNLMATEPGPCLREEGSAKITVPEAVQS